MEVGKSKLHKVAHQAGNPVKRYYYNLSSKQDSRQDSFLFRGVSIFLFLKPSTDWIKSTHIIEYNLLYSLHSKSIDLNVNLI